MCNDKLLASHTSSSRRLRPIKRGHHTAHMSQADPTSPIGPIELYIEVHA